MLPQYLVKLIACTLHIASFQALPSFSSLSLCTQKWHGPWNKVTLHMCLFLTLVNK